MSANISDNMRGNAVVSDNMKDSARRKLILEYLHKNNEVSATTATHIIGRSPTTARRVLFQLIREGLVITTGANRNRKYKIVK